MSTFKCYKQGGTGPQELYEGMVAAAKEFVVKQANSDDSADVYGETFFNLQANFDVTYDGDGGELNTTTTSEGGGKYKVVYDGEPVKILGDRDNKNKNREKITMGLPADGVTVTDPYLATLLTIIEDKNGDADLSAFLLGVILMSKCR